MADSEVYKMLQENQEADEPPRQSASFKVLQEILESGTYSHMYAVDIYVVFKQCGVYFNMGL